MSGGPRKVTSTRSNRLVVIIKYPEKGKTLRHTPGGAGSPRHPPLPSHFSRAGQENVNPVCAHMKRRRRHRPARIRRPHLPSLALASPHQTLRTTCPTGRLALFKSMRRTPSCGLDLLGVALARAPGGGGDGSNLVPRPPPASNLPSRPPYAHLHPPALHPVRRRTYCAYRRRRRRHGN
jgi:hypothetical protein